MTKPIVLTALDLETTGFNAEDGHRITEVGAMTFKVDPETLEFTHVLTYSKFVNPMRTIPEEVQRITNITPALVKDAPAWDEVSLEFSRVMRVTDIMVAHNAQFDAPFLAYELLRLKRPLNENMLTFCTMENGRFATPLGKPPRLTELCWALDVEFKDEDAHRALYDVDRMVEALKVGIRKGYFDLRSVINQVQAAKFEASAAA